jgi:hypothetical protein
METWRVMYRRFQFIKHFVGKPITCNRLQPYLVILVSGMNIIHITDKVVVMMSILLVTLGESSLNVMAHGDLREGKLRGIWRMEWVAITLHTTSEHGVSSITTADAHTSAASSRLNWRPPADLNGLVRFADGRNLVSARVPSHFKRSLPVDQIC